MTQIIAARTRKIRVAGHAEHPAAAVDAELTCPDTN
jgi:hypothetical protein